MHNKIVLIVDDTPADLQRLAKAIDRLGLTCISCAGGEEAIATLQKRHAEIDLVLLDIVMQDIDGISVLGHCKSHYPGLPVIVLSPTMNDEDVELTSRWNADSFLLKPVDNSILEKAVRKVLKAA